MIWIFKKNIKINISLKDRVKHDFYFSIKSDVVFGFRDLLFNRMDKGG